MEKSEQVREDLFEAATAVNYQFICDELISIFDDAVLFDQNVSFGRERLSRLFCRARAAKGVNPTA